MYCPNCGKQQLSNANFCTHCGTSIVGKHALNGDLSSRTQSGTEFQEESELEPGQLQHVWRKLPRENWDIRPHARYSKNPDQFWNGMPWLRGGKATLDVLITEHYFIILASFADTKVRQASETISTAAVALGSVAGGLLVSLPVAIVGEAYEKLFGKKNKFDHQALAILFKSGMMMYAKKSDLSFTSFHLKNNVLEADYSHISVAGDFKNVVMGHVNLCFLVRELERKVDHLFAGMLGDPASFLAPLQASGCVVTEHTEKFTSASQVERFLSKYYPDPLETIRENIRWCSNCAYFQNRKDWRKYGLGVFSSPVSGDSMSSSRVSDEKLPCRITSETSVTWDQYFQVNKKNRALYPENCPKFKPNAE